jgi:hypothetical protein
VVPTADLIGHDEFLLALALPKVGKRSIGGLWPQGLYQAVNSPLRDFDEALQIASGKSGLGIALTTVQLRIFGGAAAPVHLVRDTKKDLLMVVGEPVDEALSNFLKSAGIEYVARGSGNARTKVQTFLNRLFIQASPETEALVASAFFLRNRISSFDLVRNIDRIDGLKVAELLTALDCIPVRPVFASRLSDATAIDAILGASAQQLQPQHRD